MDLDAIREGYAFHLSLALTPTIASTSSRTIGDQFRAASHLATATLQHAPARATVPPSLLNALSTFVSGVPSRPTNALAHIFHAPPPNPLAPAPTPVPAPAAKRITFHALLAGYKAEHVAAPETKQDLAVQVPTPSAATVSTPTAPQASAAAQPQIIVTEAIATSMRAAMASQVNHEEAQLGPSSLSPDSSGRPLPSIVIAAELVASQEAQGALRPNTDERIQSWSQKLQEEALIPPQPPSRVVAVAPTPAPVGDVEEAANPIVEMSQDERDALWKQPPMVKYSGPALARQQRLWDLAQASADRVSQFEMEILRENEASYMARIRAQEDMHARMTGTNLEPLDVRESALRIKADALAHNVPFAPARPNPFLYHKSNGCTSSPSPSTLLPHTLQLAPRFAPRDDIYSYELAIHLGEGGSRYAWTPAASGLDIGTPAGTDRLDEERDVAFAEEMSRRSAQVAHTRALQEGLTLEEPHLPIELASTVVQSQESAVSRAGPELIAPTSRLSGILAGGDPAHVNVSCTLSPWADRVAQGLMMDIPTLPTILSRSIDTNDSLFGSSHTTPRPKTDIGEEEDANQGQPADDTEEDTTPSPRTPRFLNNDTTDPQMVSFDDSTSEAGVTPSQQSDSHSRPISPSDDLAEAVVGAIATKRPVVSSLLETGPSIPHSSPDGSIASSNLGTTTVGALQVARAAAHQTIPGGDECSLFSCLAPASAPAGVPSQAAHGQHIPSPPAPSPTLSEIENILGTAADVHLHGGSPDTWLGVVVESLAAPGRADLFWDMNIHI